MVGFIWNYSLWDNPNHDVSNHVLIFLVGSKGFHILTHFLSPGPQPWLSGSVALGADGMLGVFCGSCVVCSGFYTVKLK